MNNTPKVSVIMSVFNATPFLAESVSSILNQTYKNFEFIIINDGSTDKTSEILSRFSDPRLKIIHQNNRGFTKSINYCLRLAKGKYIARMDADDISLPERLSRQISFLDSHPDIALCGTYAIAINESGQEIGRYTYPPVNHSDILRLLFRHNPFIHPSVMFRKKVIDQIGPYNEKFPVAQDYELWSRLAPQFKTANLPEFLLRYRILKKSVTRQKNRSWYRLWLGIKIRLLVIWRLIFKAS